jgi:nitric oxide reductase subunit B
MWNKKLVSIAFWSINIGLLLMVLLDLFPAGILQFNAVIENGLWFARSNQFIDSSAFQNLTWMRIVGGSLFVIGGVIPLSWFIVSRSSSLKKTNRENFTDNKGKDSMDEKSQKIEVPDMIMN